MSEVRCEIVDRPLQDDVLIYLYQPHDDERVPILFKDGRSALGESLPRRAELPVSLVMTRDEFTALLNRRGGYAMSNG